jgi:hypothetical protein
MNDIEKSEMFNRLANVEKEIAVVSQKMDVVVALTKDNNIALLGDGVGRVGLSTRTTLLEDESRRRQFWQKWILGMVASLLVGLVGKLAWDIVVVLPRLNELSSRIQHEEQKRKP